MIVTRLPDNKQVSQQTRPARVLKSACGQHYVTDPRSIAVTFVTVSCMLTTVISTMPARLPFELLAHILDIVASCRYEDFPSTSESTLRNCALVSSQLVAPCQKYLFSHIQISFRRPNAISRLQKILDVDSPHIGSYVKVLSVTFLSQKDLRRPGLDRILQRCTQVTSLTIGSEVTATWEAVSENTRQALESIIHSPTCKSLSFYAFHLPLSIFLDPGGNHNLESLCFVVEGIPNQGSLVPLSGNIPDRAESYASLRFLSVLPWMMPVLLSAKLQDGQYLFDLTSLGTLSVDYMHWRSTADVIMQMLGRTPHLGCLWLNLSPCK